MWAGRNQRKEEKNRGGGLKRIITIFGNSNCLFRNLTGAPPNSNRLATALALPKCRENYRDSLGVF